MSLGHGPTIMRDGLVLHLDAANPKSYPGTGSTWFDLSKKQNHAQINNYTKEPIFETDYGGVFNFNSDKRFGIDIPELNNANSYSVMWVGINGGGDQYGGISRNTAWEHGNHLIGWRTGAINSDSGRDTNTNSEGDNFIICHINNTETQEVDQYLNGAYYGKFTYTSWAAKLSWSFGGRGSGTGHQYTGKIACGLIYNRLLSELEIQQNFNALRGRFGI